jgi:hypothetical protein
VNDWDSQQQCMYVPILRSVVIASVAMDLLESATRPSMSSWHLDTLYSSMFKTCCYGDHERHGMRGKGEMEEEEEQEKE